MTVTPHRKTLFHTRSDLHQFLSACQQKLLEQQAQIVSITQKIDWVDPLTVLHQLAQPQQFSFYFERNDPALRDLAIDSRTAIAAFGSAAQLQTEGSDRFRQAQKFVHTTLARTITIGDQSDLTGPHFFCGFTFFDRAAQPDSCRSESTFAAATVLLPEWQIVRQPRGCFCRGESGDRCRN